MSNKTKILIVFLGLIIVGIICCILSYRKGSSLQTELSKEVSNVPLKVQGSFPEWLDGVLVRNSAIPVYKDGQPVSHEFDGLAMLHSFTFDKGGVSYTNKFLLSQAYDAVINRNTSEYQGFASTPSIWKKILDFFPGASTWVTNGNVNVSKYGNDYVALTEAPGPVRFDLNTLETLGTLEFSDALPQKGWQSAHPHFDYASKENINFLIEFGKESYYVLYRMAENSTTREMIGKVPVALPAYMHSFAMTDHYLVLTEFPLFVRPLDLVMSSKGFIHQFKWMPERGTRFLVIDRSSGKLVSQAITDPIFSFHHVNAYESEDGNELVIDLVAYSDLSLMPEIFPQASSSENSANWKTRLMRYRYSLSNKEITSEVLSERMMEFPRINERLDGKPYRYLYMTLADQLGIGFKMSELGKFDLEAKQLKTWKEPGSHVLEPIFVPSPGATAEDDGIVLTVIQNFDTERAYLIALDAKSLTEIARAEMPWHIPSSFHGQFFADSQFLKKD